MDVQAGLALYWLQRLITFGVGRIRVKTFMINMKCSKMKDSELRVHVTQTSMKFSIIADLLTLDHKPVETVSD